MKGIYKITDSVSGRYYVGSSVDISRRWLQHRYRLDRGTHPNPILQSAWRAHGAASFSFCVVEEVSCEADLLPREQQWLDASLSAQDKMCMNVLPVAGSCLGVKRSPETRARMAASQKGKKASPEARMKMRLAKLGKKQNLSPERLASLRRQVASISNDGLRRVPHRRLTLEGLREFWSLREGGMSIPKLSRKFSISESTAWRIINKKSYAGPQWQT